MLKRFLVSVAAVVFALSIGAALFPSQAIIVTAYLLRTNNGADILSPSTFRSNLGAAASGAVGSSGLTMSTNRLLGRTTSSTGAIEEITVSGCTFSGGTLTCGGSGTVTSITAGTGLTGGSITTSGTIALDTPVTVPHGGTGVVTLTGLVLGNGASAMSAYGGTSCTNQFPRSLNASGAATCASVANTDLVNSAVTLNSHSLSLGGSLTLAFTDFSGNISVAQMAPTQAFEDHLTTSMTSQTSATFIKITLGTPSFDTPAAGWDATNKYYVVQVKGIYEVSGGCTFAGSFAAAGTGLCFASLNGTIGGAGVQVAQGYVRVPALTASDFYVPMAARPVCLNVSDTVELDGYAVTLAGGNTLQISTGAGPATFLSLMFLKAC